MIIRSRFVLPVHSPAIKDGGVQFAEGAITAVAPFCELPSDTTVDFGDSVIMPGFVNAHTHLELSTLSTCQPTSPDFIEWLTRLVDSVQIESATAVSDAVLAGAKECVASGVTALGDITRHPAATRQALAGTALRGVSYGEVIAIGSRRELLLERIEAAVAGTAGRIARGISPHAPYTVEPDGLRACSARSEEHEMPLCVHLAETPDEEQFTRCGDGPFKSYLQSLGVWDEQIPCSGLAPVALAQATGLLSPRTLVAHANYVSDEDIATIASSGASVAYCPRTHAAFGHAPHRYADMMSAGVNVCIGTDSRASTPSLSVLDEIRFLRACGNGPGSDRLVHMATRAGIKALGLGGQVGTLAAGQVADLVVIPLEPTAPKNRWDVILEQTTQPAEVFIAGLPQLRSRSR